MKFKHLPGYKTEVVKPIVVEKKKRGYTKHIVKGSRNAWEFIKNIVLVALVVFTVTYFGPKIFITMKKINSVRAEINFAINHPDVVKPIRELYDMSHSRVDADLIKVLEVK